MGASWQTSVHIIMAQAKKITKVTKLRDVKSMSYDKTGITGAPQAMQFVS